MGGDENCITTREERNIMIVTPRMGMAQIKEIVPWGNKESQRNELCLRGALKLRNKKNRLLASREERE